ncbi:unnamed protein product, partial [Arabidopsis halleri]
MWSSESSHHLLGSLDHTTRPCGRVTSASIFPIHSTRSLDHTTRPRGRVTPVPGLLKHSTTSLCHSLDHVFRVFSNPHSTRQAEHKEE